jgi:hypothetical protein
MFSPTRRAGWLSLLVLIGALCFPLVSQAQPDDQKDAKDKAGKAGMMKGQGAKDGMAPM